MNRSNVRPNDGAPAYLDTLRSLGDYYRKTDGRNFTIIGIHQRSVCEINILEKECEKWKITIEKVDFTDSHVEYTLHLPFHNYRPHFL
jgi:hypothetical protein